MRVFIIYVNFLQVSKTYLLSNRHRVRTARSKTRDVSSEESQAETSSTGIYRLLSLDSPSSKIFSLDRFCNTDSVYLVCVSEVVCREELIGGRSDFLN